MKKLNGTLGIGSRLLILTVLLLKGCGNQTGSGNQEEAGVAVETGMQPNFVIIIADDLGWNDVGAYGNASVYTPNIDRLAHQGVQFRQAFLTTSSCSASRASILTGKYPHSNGLVHLHQALPVEEKTIASFLKPVGYFTGAAGKWHIGGAAAKDFDLVREDKQDSATRYWLDLLRERPRDQPFFIWLASRDPHRPHDGGKEFIEKYDLSDFDLPEGFIEGPGVREELLDYYLEVSRFDYDVGRVVDELTEQGVLDNTFVLVMSDNGRPFHPGKTKIYDDGIKTPFIVHWPRGMGEPGEYEHLVSAIDIAPTVLELAGAQIPQAMQGRSFTSVFSDRDHVLRRYVHAERNWHGKNAHERAVRSANFLYKENQYPDHGDCITGMWRSGAPFQALLKAHERGELGVRGEVCFAEARDKVELLKVSDEGVDYINLAGNPEYEDVVAEMAHELRLWRESTGDFDYEHYEPPPRARK